MTNKEAVFAYFEEGGSREARAQEIGVWAREQHGKHAASVAAVVSLLAKEGKLKLRKALCSYPGGIKRETPLYSIHA